MNKVIEEVLEENNWRDGEFAKLKVNATGVEDALWCRMAILLIYAHWEGFVVSALRTLIDYLNDLEIACHDLHGKMVVVSLGDAYRSLSGKQSFEQRVEFTARFRNLLNETARFKKKIETRSNLSARVLEELCTMYGFDFQQFDDVTFEIDKLVNVRNSIAHGENAFLPNMDNVVKYIAAVTRAMDIFRNEVSIFVEDEKYRHKSGDQPQASMSPS